PRPRRAASSAATPARSPRPSARAWPRCCRAPGATARPGRVPTCSSAPAPSSATCARSAAAPTSRRWTEPAAGSARAGRTDTMRPMKRELLTVVVAARDEADALPLLHARVARVLDGLREDGVDGRILYEIGRAAGRG